MIDLTDGASPPLRSTGAPAQPNPATDGNDVVEIESSEDDAAAPAAAAPQMPQQDATPATSAPPEPSSEADAPAQPLPPALAASQEVAAPAQPLPPAAAASSEAGAPPTQAAQCAPPVQASHRADAASAAVEATAGDEANAPQHAATEAPAPMERAGAANATHAADVAPGPTAEQVPGTQLGQQAQEQRQQSLADVLAAAPAIARRSAGHCAALQPGAGTNSSEGSDEETIERLTGLPAHCVAAVLQAQAPVVAAALRMPAPEPTAAEVTAAKAADHESPAGGYESDAGGDKDNQPNDNAKSCKQPGSAAVQKRTTLPLVDTHATGAATDIAALKAGGEDQRLTTIAAERGVAVDQPLRSPAAPLDTAPAAPHSQRRGRRLSNELLAEMRTGDERQQMRTSPAQQRSVQAASGTLPLASSPAPVALATEAPALDNAHNAMSTPKRRSAQRAASADTSPFNDSPLQRYVHSQMKPAKKRCEMPAVAKEVQAAHELLRHSDAGHTDTSLEPDALTSRARLSSAGCNASSAPSDDDSAEADVPDALAPLGPLRGGAMSESGKADGRAVEAAASIAQPAAAMRCAASVAQAVAQAGATVQCEPTQPTVDAAEQATAPIKAEGSPAQSELPQQGSHGSDKHVAIARTESVVPRGRGHFRAAHSAGAKDGRHRSASGRPSRPNSHAHSPAACVPSFDGRRSHSPAGATGRARSHAQLSRQRGKASARSLPHATTGTHARPQKRDTRCDLLWSILYLLWPGALFVSDKCH